MSDFRFISAFAGKRVHMVGIKGVGMTALAEVLASAGAIVSGSDTEERFLTDEVLERIGISPSVGFSPEHVPDGTETLVYSTAYAPDANPEIVAATGRGIAVMSYPEAVGSITRERMSLLVTGTHGKTTTSAMLAEALRGAGEDPAAIIGSHVRSWKGNALSGSGKYLVLEADEYQGKLGLYQPFAAILTSVDWDHPDFFPDERSYEETFRTFVKRIPRHGALVHCADSASVARVASEASCTVLSYGFHEDAMFRISEYEAVPLSGGEGAGIRARFSITCDGESLGVFSLRQSGRHNARNAAAVVAMARFLRLDMEAVRTALSAFSGTARRGEYVGEYRGAPVYDDYAHHPEELRATLSAFRDSYPDRNLIAVFHPHTFTRTKALLPDFAQSFDLADRVLVLDIYGSAREVEGGVSSADLVREINRYAPGKAEHRGTIPEAIDTLRASMGKDDLLVTFGAGDVWRVAEALVSPGAGNGD